MITILEKFLTELEMGGGGWGKSDYKDCFRSQKFKTKNYFYYRTGEMGVTISKITIQFFTLRGMMCLDK